MQKFDVAIIGGGASGLACAVRLKQLDKNINVAIVEAGERLGKKVASTGNGQGNLSNADMSACHYHGSFKLLAQKLCSDGAENPLALFDFLTVQDKSGRIYPSGRQASSISDSLIKQVKDFGVTILLNSRAVSLSKGFKITLSNGQTVLCNKVLLAVGGKAQKQFLTDGSAYALAKSLGHTVTPLYPSLVQLKCAGGFKQLKGIRADCVVTVKEGGKVLAKTGGDIIFTDYGVSGNAIFYASAYCAGKENIELLIEFLPEVEREEIIRVIEKRKSLGYQTSELLGGTMHNALGREIIKRAKTDRAEVIASLVKSFPVKVEGSLGWDYAQVTKGGIPMSEVKSNLESKLVKGLYFAGEVLDLDGDCGGYNLHFAFASGMYVAESMLGVNDND